MGLFGLSPLVLSFIAGSFFKTADDGLNVSGYTCFLATLTLVVHLIGTINLRTVPSIEPEPPSFANDEETPLIPRSEQDSKQTVKDVLNDSSFWLLAASVGIALGSVGQLFSTCSLLI
jgi:hypothetical protein